MLIIKNKEFKIELINYKNKKYIMCNWFWFG